MPTYDYVCKDCNHHFEKHVSLEEHQQRKVQCPKCGSKNLEHVPEPFYAVTSKKS